MSSVVNSVSVRARNGVTESKADLMAMELSEGKHIFITIKYLK